MQVILVGIDGAEVRVALCQSLVRGLVSDLVELQGGTAAVTVDLRAFRLLAPPTAEVLREVQRVLEAHGTTRPAATAAAVEVLRCLGLASLPIRATVSSFPHAVPGRCSLFSFGYLCVAAVGDDETAEFRFDATGAHKRTVRPGIPHRPNALTGFDMRCQSAATTAWEVPDERLRVDWSFCGPTIPPERIASICRTKDRPSFTPPPGAERRFVVAAETHMIDAVTEVATTADGAVFARRLTFETRRFACGPWAAFGAALDGRQRFQFVPTVDHGHLFAFGHDTLRVHRLALTDAMSCAVVDFSTAVPPGCPFVGGRVVCGSPVVFFADPRGGALLAAELDVLDTPEEQLAHGRMYRLPAEMATEGDAARLPVLYRTDEDRAVVAIGVSRPDGRVCVAECKREAPLGPLI